MSEPTARPWVIVPREPTEEMLNAAGEQFLQGLGEYYDGADNKRPFRRVYRAMIAATPPVNAYPALDELVKALEALSDIAGEGSEDYPDDKPVIVEFGRCKDFSLTLGDFRRVNAALSRIRATGGFDG